MERECSHNERMDYFNVEFAMPGFGGDENPRKPASTHQPILQQAGDLMVQRKFTEAIAILEAALKGVAETEPSSAPLHEMLTAAYVGSRRLPEAKQQLERLRQRGVKDPMLSVQLAVIALRMRHFDEAILCFSEAQTLGAEPGEWSVLFGNALLRTGQLSEAEEVYQEAMPVAKELRYDLFFGLATIRMQQKRFQEAAELAIYALKANKPKTRAIFFLGLAAMRMGEPERSLRMFKQYARLQPDSVAPYRWLERLTRELGEDAEADAYNIKAREILESRRLKRLEKQRYTSE